MRSRPLVLSVFPGLGLLDKAFEKAGATVVRGPDILWGGDVRDFHPPSGVFDAVIGGPPCQQFSTAQTIVGSDKLDLIPEFIRVVEEAAPRVVVMENVPPTLQHYHHIKEWNTALIRDWDCGGETNRKRAFWTWPFRLRQPPVREGKASLSVMASTWKRGASTSKYLSDKSFLPGDLSIDEYERLQGVPGIAQGLRDIGANRQTIITMLGNGVPLSLGTYVAEAAMRYMGG